MRNLSSLSEMLIVQTAAVQPSIFCQSRVHELRSSRLEGSQALVQALVFAHGTDATNLEGKQGPRRSHQKTTRPRSGRTWAFLRRQHLRSDAGQNVAFINYACNVLPPKLLILQRRP